MRTKTVWIAVLVVLVAGNAAVVDCYPRSELWTGGCYVIPSWPYWGFWWETPITWGNFLWMTVPSNERGFARYDLTPVPDGATVTAATVHYFVYRDTLAPATEIRLLTIEPFPDSEPQARAVYDSIASGLLVATVDSTIAGWNSAALSEDACRAIEERLTTTDWLGLGWLYPGTDSADAMARGWRDDSLKTYLTVEHAPTGCTETPSHRRPAFSLAPNPTAGRVRLVPGRDLLPGRLTITVADAAGRVVFETVGLDPAAPGELDLRELAPGPYFVTAATWTGSTTHKLVLR